MHTVRIANHSFSLPLHLGEVTPDQAKRLGGLLLAKEEEVLPFILHRLVSTKTQNLLRGIDPAQLLKISQLLLWMLEDRKVNGVEEVNPLTTSFRIGLTHYYLPQPSLNDVTVNEWMWVEATMQQLVDNEKDEDAMARIIAVICRQLRPRNERFSEDFDGYPRVHFNPERIPAATETMKKAPGWVSAIVLDYLMRCKSMLSTRYATIFSGEKTGGVNWGWKGSVMAVAETGIFGRETDVLKENIHNLCIFLVKKRSDQKEDERKLEKLKREKGR